MSIASTPTLLSLDRWAKIVGLNPVHFAGATAGNFFPLSAACDDVWAQHAWQSPEQLVSREEVGYEIAKAETDIKNILGYSPAPDWEWREQHSYSPSAMRMRQMFPLIWGKVIAPGVRGVEEIELGAEVIYSDPNADGFNELATVTVSTTATDPREVKLFFVDQAGEPEFEIRPLLKVVLDADAGTATITANSWLFINPELWEEIPIENSEDQYDPIDISTTANYVDAVDVYRIFNDTSAFGSSFLISRAENYSLGFCAQCGYGTCLGCGATTQGGTFAITSAQIPAVMPYPASYSDGAWRSDSFANCGVPTLVAFNYYAGEVDKRYATHRSLDPLSNFWADTIAWLAASRLTKGVCGCDNVRERFANIQRDLTRNDQTVGYSRSERMDLWRSAFGTREGEVRAWQAVTRIVGDQVSAGAAL